MDISSVIDGIASGAAANIKVNEGDYTGKDGLLYCGKCHTPKQTEIGVDGSGSIRRVMCLCQCETDKVRKEKDAQKQAEFERRVKAMRSEGFPEKQMRVWTFANDDMQNSSITTAMRNYVGHFPGS